MSDNTPGSGDRPALTNDEVREDAMVAALLASSNSTTVSSAQSDPSARTAADNSTQTPDTGAQGPPGLTTSPGDAAVEAPTRGFGGNPFPSLLGPAPNETDDLLWELRRSMRPDPLPENEDGRNRRETPSRREPVAGEEDGFQRHLRQLREYRGNRGGTPSRREPVAAEGFQHIFSHLGLTAPRDQEGTDGRTSFRQEGAEGRTLFTPVMPRRFVPPGVEDRPRRNEVTTEQFFREQDRRLRAFGAIQDPQERVEQAQEAHRQWVEKFRARIPASPPPTSQEASTDGMGALSGRGVPVGPEPHPFGMHPLPRRGTRARMDNQPPAPAGLTLAPPFPHGLPPSLTSRADRLAPPPMPHLFANAGRHGPPGRNVARGSIDTSTARVPAFPDGPRETVSRDDPGYRQWRQEYLNAIRSGSPETVNNFVRTSEQRYKNTLLLIDEVVPLLQPQRRRLNGQMPGFTEPPMPRLVHDFRRPPANIFLGDSVRAATNGRERLDVTSGNEPARQNETSPVLADPSASRDEPGFGSTVDSSRPQGPVPRTRGAGRRAVDAPSTIETAARNLPAPGSLHPSVAHDHESSIQTSAAREYARWLEETQRDDRDFIAAVETYARNLDPGPIPTQIQEQVQRDRRAFIAAEESSTDVWAELEDIRSRSRVAARALQDEAAEEASVDRNPTPRDNSDDPIQFRRLQRPQRNWENGVTYRRSHGGWEAALPLNDSERSQLVRSGNEVRRHRRSNAGPFENTVNIDDNQSEGRTVEVPVRTRTVRQIHHPAQHTDFATLIGPLNHIAAVSRRNPAQLVNQLLAQEADLLGRSRPNEPGPPRNIPSSAQLLISERVLSANGIEIYISTADSSTDADCPICMEDYIGDRRAYQSTLADCSHGFCRACIDRMLESPNAIFLRCPLCRTSWRTRFRGVARSTAAPASPASRPAAPVAPVAPRVSMDVFPHILPNQRHLPNDVNMQVFTQGDILAVYTLSPDAEFWYLTHADRMITLNPTLHSYNANTRDGVNLVVLGPNLMVNSTVVTLLETTRVPQGELVVYRRSLPVGHTAREFETEAPYGPI